MPKLLADFLQEQQEPFALEVYLVERGHSLNNIARCTLHNSAQYVAPNCSYFLRTLFDQFVVNGGRKSFLIGGSKSGQRTAPQGNTTLFNCCGNCFLEGEPTNSKLRRDEDCCKHLSPVSIFGQTENKDSPFHYKQRNRKAQRGPSNSISQCRLKQQVLGYDQYIINKKALQQRKQLRIECTKEVIEKYREKEKKNIEILGSGEICKYVLENVWIWSQECINESNIFNQLHSELLASEDEWNAVFEMQKFKISIEIENGIMENVINEMITCMVEW